MDLKLGSSGRAVEVLQEALNNLGAFLKIDGEFGQKTRTEVIKYQKKNELTPDGIVGDLTWISLGVKPVADVPPPPIEPTPIPPPLYAPRPSKAKNIDVPPGKVTVAGLDISHYQPTVDWKKVAKGDTKFCFLKASEGLGTRDKKFENHYKGCKDNDILVSGYHFFRPDYSAEAQANLFLKVAQPKKGDLLPVLDFEDHGIRTPHEQLQKALQWLTIVGAEIGRLPIVYLSPSFMNELENPQELYHYPLWLANYGVKTPHVPPPWNSWHFWQYAEKGKVEGIDADGVDHNLFNGTMEDLKNFIL